MRTAPPRSGPAPTKREFVGKVDALCADAKRRLASISGAVVARIADEDAHGVAAEVKKALPVADRLLARLRALTPPRGEEVVLGKLDATIAGVRRRIPALVEALEAEDVSTIEVLVAELRHANHRAGRLAEDYGLSCRFTVGG